MGVLSCVGAVPGGKPFETSGKDSIMLRRRKHGTTGRLALPHQKRLEGVIAETVRSAPGRDPRMARFIRIFGGLARLLAGVLKGLGLLTGSGRPPGA
jgi:hypothetical protein